MVKRGPKPKVAGKNSEPESIGGYFRKVFKEKPKLLVTRSNDEVLRRWLSDHPGEREVPDRIKQNLANVKSVLRKKLRKRGRPKGSVNSVPTTPASAAVASHVSTKSLEALEIRIDDVLGFARDLQAEELANVVSLLRRARNEVVWKLGQ